MDRNGLYRFSDDGLGGTMHGQPVRFSGLRHFCPSPTLCFIALLATIIVAILSTSTTNDRNSTISKRKNCSHDGRIECLSFSPDGKMVASASFDGASRIWDVAARSDRIVARSKIGGFTGVAFSPDGRTLASTCFDGRLVLSDLAGVRQETSVRANETESAVRVGVFSPDGNSLATGGDDRAVHVWDVSSARERLTLRCHRGMVRGLAYFPDGRSIVSIAADGRAVTWDAESGTVREEFDGGFGPLWSVAISRSGRWVALGGRDGITLRDLEGGRSRGYRCPGGPIMSLGFLPGGTILASASQEGGITLWKVTLEGLQTWRTLPAQGGRIKAMAMSPDGKTLVTGGDDAILRFWPI